MKLIYAHAGDVFFTHSETVLGRLIRWAESDPNETNGVWANHAGIVVEDGWIGAGDPLATPAVVVEALWKTRKGPLDTSKIQVRVFRPIPALTPEELAKFRAASETFVGATYGWWKLGVQLADRAIFKGTKVLTTAMYRDDRPICSYLAAKVYAASESVGRQVARFQLIPNVAGAFAFGMPPQAADPDEMMDFCLAQPKLWEEVR
jgi:hypothetical protein